MDITSAIGDSYRVEFAIVKIPNPSEVADYLYDHLDMGWVLLVACQAACDTFENEAQLCLEVYRDPEIDDKYLVLYVRQEHYEADILDKIDSASAKYEKELVGKSGWFLLTTDFRPPG
jgi:hypothetical protein